MEPKDVSLLLRFIDFLPHEEDKRLMGEVLEACKKGVNGNAPELRKRARAKKHRAIKVVISFHDQHGPLTEKEWRRLARKTKRYLERRPLD